MREGPYELLLIGEGDTAFEERDLNGLPCVRAEPNLEYHVQVNVYRDSSGRFPAKYIRFGLYVDGNDVQYWKRIDLSNEKLLPSDPSEPVRSRFWGFKKNVNDIRSFVFSIPDTSSKYTSGDHTISISSLGSVKLVVYEAQVSVGVYQNQDGYYEAPSQQKIGEGKFWQQASVTTAAGKKVNNDREKFAPLPRWSNVSKEPLATLLLRYHTSSMIGFLEQHAHRLVADSSSSRKGPPVILDLTGDDTEPEQQLQQQQLLHQEQEQGSNNSSTHIVDAQVDHDRSSPNSKRQRLNETETSHVQEEEGDEQATNREIPIDEQATIREIPIDEQAADREIPIDEEISYVVRNKVVTVVDFSTED